MSVQLRKTGIDVLGDAPWGTHFCHFYETKQDLLDTVVPYFKAGLESKEFCLWVVSTSDLITVDEAKGALAQAVPDLDRHLSDENIEILEGIDWYLEKNVLNLERVRIAWDAKLKRALARGYDGLRVSGDTFWVGKKDWKDFCVYEKQLNDSISDQRMTVLCTYPLAKSGAAEVLDVAKTHRFAIARRHGEWEVIETPELVQAKVEVKKLNEELEQRVIERTNELRVANEDLRKEIADGKQADDEIRRQKEILQQIFDHIPVMISFVEADGRLKLVNREWERTLGWTLEEIRQQNLDVFAECYPDSQYRQQVLKFVAEAKEEWVDFKTRVRDGRMLDQTWVRVHLSDGTSVGIGKDITVRKHAEEALDERLRFETLVTELSAAFANLSPNEVDSEIDKGLQTLVEFLGVDRASFFQFGEDWTTLCRTHSYTVPGIEPLPPLPIVLKDQFPWIMDQLRRGVTVKWSRIPDDMPQEAAKEKEYAAKLGVKSGLHIPVVVGGSVICAITFTSIATYQDWPDATVARLRLVGEIFAAAVERKQAEEALREAERKYRDIFEHAGEGIFQSTPDGRFIVANPALARMHGFASPEELIRSRLDISRQIYVDSTRREEFKRQIEEQGAVRGFEHEVRRKDGGKFWISVNAHAVRDEQGAIQYYEGTAQDINERKTAEEKIKATSEQLRALSASVQSAREEEAARIARELHDELGSALTSLKLDLELIRRDAFSSTSDAETSRSVEKVETMMQLIDQTVDTVRRISSELRPRVLDDLGLVAAIRWQAKQFEAQAGILCRYDFRLEEIDLDQQQSTAIFRVFQEALTNVLRHAQATRVDITLEKEDGELRLTIRDNGRGITAGEQSDSVSLGLLGMRERVHLLGGTINITGTRGKGTVITVQVPLPGKS